MNKPKEPYSFSLNDGKSDPVTVPHDIAQYLIQRQQNMDDDNREIERLQKSEKKLRELMEVIDAHDIQIEDCDRRGHLSCDCLHRKMKEIKVFLGLASENESPVAIWPVKHL